MSILLLATCAIILLLSACKETKSVEQSNQKSQPKQTVKALKLTKAYKNLTTDADTTCAGWHIILQSADAPYKVKNEDFYDKTVLITLYKNGKLLVNRQEITTKNLHKKPQPYLQLTPPGSILSHEQRLRLALATASLKAMNAGFTRSSMDKMAG